MKRAGWATLGLCYNDNSNHTEPRLGVECVGLRVVEMELAANTDGPQRLIEIERLAHRHEVVEVGLGAQDGDVIEITSGLSPDDEVLLFPLESDFVSS